VLPRPALVLFGTSPVAEALANLAAAVGLGLRRARAEEALPADPGERRFVVVSTQGESDQRALTAALAIDAEYRAFVGSRRKMAALREKLLAAGVEAALVDSVKAPAGLDLGAIIPEEIALSILAEITQRRRKR